MKEHEQNAMVHMKDGLCINRNGTKKKCEELEIVHKQRY